jgi:hypothetical protein
MGQLSRYAAIVLAVASALFGAPPMRAAEPVDLLLVLAADVSRSVDSQKFQLQREGYAAALVNSRVLDVDRRAEDGPSVRGSAPRIATVFCRSYLDQRGH